MVEENLYTMIKMKKKAKIQELLIYDDYNSLMQLFLRYDAKKVISLLNRPFYWGRPCLIRKIPT
jgi:hypothetical protein